jgi:hypothetical protein
MLLASCFISWNSEIQNLIIKSIGKAIVMSSFTLYLLVAINDVGTSGAVNNFKTKVMHIAHFEIKTNKSFNL